MNKKERRIQRPWWKRTLILLFGCCQVCADNEALYMGDCRRDNSQPIVLCGECCDGFSKVTKIKKAMSTLEMG